MTWFKKPLHERDTVAVLAAAPAGITPSLYVPKPSRGWAMPLYIGMLSISKNSKKSIMDFHGLLTAATHKQALAKWMAAHQKNSVSQ